MVLPDAIARPPSLGTVTGQSATAQATRTAWEKHPICVVFSILGRGQLLRQLVADHFFVVAQVQPAAGEGERVPGAAALQDANAAQLAVAGRVGGDGDQLAGAL